LHPQNIYKFSKVVILFEDFWLTKDVHTHQKLF